MTQSGFAAFASSGRISGSGLASARISGRPAIFLTIEGFRTPPPDSPRNTSAPAITLDQVIVGAEVFLGLSAGGVLKPSMVKKMAGRPLILALALVHHAL